MWAKYFGIACHILKLANPKIKHQSHFKSLSKIAFFFVFRFSLLSLSVCNTWKKWINYESGKIVYILVKEKKFGRIHKVAILLLKRCQSGLVVRELDSRLKGCGFESRLIQYTKWTWGQSHAKIDYCTQFWLIVEK